MSKIITLSQLRAAGACAPALRRFAAEFGESTPVTPALAVKYADQYNWYWAAAHLLSPLARAEYETARAPARAAYDQDRARAQAEYDRAVAPVWAAYDRAVARAQDKYKGAVVLARVRHDKVVARARAERGKAIALARVRHDRAVALAQAERNKVYARAWATLYTKEGI
jgi:hypothetical protein